MTNSKPISKSNYLLIVNRELTSARLPHQRIYRSEGLPDLKMWRFVFFALKSVSRSTDFRFVLIDLGGQFSRSMVQAVWLSRKTWPDDGGHFGTNFIQVKSFYLIKPNTARCGEVRRQQETSEESENVSNGAEYLQANHHRLWTRKVSIEAVIRRNVIFLINS